MERWSQTSAQFNKNGIMKPFLSYLVISSITLLTACAASRPVHSITTKVYGAVPVSNIRIAYGPENNIEFPGPTRPGQGNTTGGPMPIPETMLVSWIVAGERQEVAVPLKGKLSRSDKIGLWSLKFYGERLEMTTRTASTTENLRSGSTHREIRDKPGVKISRMG
jgi:hypothetical protein